VDKRQEWVNMKVEGINETTDEMPTNGMEKRDKKKLKRSKRYFLMILNGSLRWMVSSLI